MIIHRPACEIDIHTITCPRCGGHGRMTFPGYHVMDDSLRGYAERPGSVVIECKECNGRGTVSAIVGRRERRL